MGIEPTQPAWKAGILPLNYARNTRPTTTSTLGETGFEPVKANATRFTVWPLWPLRYSPRNTHTKTQPKLSKASGGNRTHNRRFTKPELCQLSYTSAKRARRRVAEYNNCATIRKAVPEKVPRSSIFAGGNEPKPSVIAASFAQF